MRLLERLHQHGLDDAGAPALSDFETTLSYAELSCRIRETARSLRERGVRRVGLLGENSLEWVIFDLACLEAGVLNVPIPGFFSSRQRQHLCRSAALEALYDADADHWQPLPPARPDRIPAGTAKITFTSGSTGTPRGVCLSAGNLDSTTEALARAIGEQSIREHLCVLPLATLLENVAGIYLPLWLGVRTRVLPGHRLGFADAHRFDLFRFLSTLNELAPESIILVPQLLTALVLAAERGLPVPGSLKFIAVGGGKVPMEVLEKAALSGLPVFEGYGLSEACSVVSLNTPARQRTGSTGQPLAHTRLRLTDDGVIQLRGDSVMLGYLGEEPLRDRWLDTGDLGEIDADGYLHVTGRRKNLIITAWGRNISPEWLESEMLADPAIVRIAVFGEGDTTLTAVVQARDGFDEANVERIIAQTNRRLPGYARIGRVIHAREPFSVANGQLTANGRVIRRAVADGYLTPSSVSPESIPQNPPSRPEKESAS